MKSKRNIIIALAAERHANRDVDFGKVVSAPADEERKQTNRISPEDFDNCVKTEDELISVLGRKWKSRLPMLGQLVSYCQRRVQDECLPLPNGDLFIFKRLPVACTGKLLVSVFGNSRKVNRLVQTALEIGYLVRITQTYRFGSRDREYNYSYQYACNEKVGALIRETCRNRKIGIPLTLVNRECVEALTFTSGNLSSTGTGAVEEEPPKESACALSNQALTISTTSLVDRFAAELGVVPDVVAGFSLAKRHLGLKNIEDWQIKELARWKYRELVEPREKEIACMNIGLLPTEQIRFEPNIRRDSRGSVMRVGWRATSSIMSMKAHEGGDPNYKGRWRKDYLAEHFGERGYFEYDVRASIYQISHLINFGEWVGNGLDPYEEMFGGKFSSKDDRNAYKDFCMALYFDLPSLFMVHNRLRIPRCIARYGKDRIKEAVSFAKGNMERFTGQTLFNEVFLHESLLYIDFVRALRRRSIDVVQIYDGFYIERNRIADEELNELMGACADAYYCNYRSWKQSQKRLLSAYPIG